MPLRQLACSLPPRNRLARLTMGTQSVAEHHCPYEQRTQRHRKTPQASTDRSFKPLHFESPRWLQSESDRESVPVPTDDENPFAMHGVVGGVSRGEARPASCPSKCHRVSPILSADPPLLRHSRRAFRHRLMKFHRRCPGVSLHCLLITQVRSVSAPDHRISISCSFLLYNNPFVSVAPILPYYRVQITIIAVMITMAVMKIA